VIIFYVNQLIMSSDLRSKGRRFDS